MIKSKKNPLHDMSKLITYNVVASNLILIAILQQTGVNLMNVLTILLVSIMVYCKIQNEYIRETFEIIERKSYIEKERYANYTKKAKVLIIHPVVVGVTLIVQNQSGWNETAIMVVTGLLLLPILLVSVNPKNTKTNHTEKKKLDKLVNNANFSEEITLVNFLIKERNLVEYSTEKNEVFGQDIETMNFLLSQHKNASMKVRTLTEEEIVLALESLIDELRDDSPNKQKREKRINSLERKIRKIKKA